jgi:Uma2 family endonuclease
MSTSTTTQRLTVAEYDRMVEVGTLGEDDQVELIEGRLVQKMSKSPAHRVTVQRMLRAIERLLPPGWYVAKEDPVCIPQRDSEPEPDVSVVRGSIDDYADHHPGPGDVALVVEVTRTSVAKDQALASVYLDGGIPVYWIVNLVDRQVEVYTAELAEPVILGEHDHAELVLAGQLAGRIAVAELLP